MTEQTEQPKKPKKPRFGGRQKGTPNKWGPQLREMLLGALDDVGGRKYLAEQAILNPGPFMSLLGKTLPKEITADVEVAGVTIVATILDERI